MTTPQVEGALKAVEEALYDIERNRSYIMRLNDFDSIFELDTLDGHRIQVEVTHSKLSNERMMTYELSDEQITCPECQRKWSTTERVVDATLGLYTWHLDCICGYRRRVQGRV